MKATFRRNGEILDFAIDEEITTREKEFRQKYDDSEVQSVSLTFKEGVVLKNIHNFNDVDPETVEEIIFNIK